MQHELVDPVLVWEVLDELPDEPACIVDAGVGEANAAAASLRDVRPLSCLVRDATATVIGGAIGRTWGECCELQQLWVHDSQRGQGIGSELLHRFHARAEQRGCRTFYLETFSFQAPAFYRQRGYAVLAEIAGFAPDISKFVMVRRLGVPR